MEAFEDDFGLIENKEITGLEFLRWRATLLGSEGEHAKRIVRQAAKARAPAKVAPAPNDDTVPVVVVKTTGTKCSNTDCPLQSRYQAALHKKIWSQCVKDCTQCQGKFK